MGTRKLLFSVTKKDLVIETFRCGGPGGQNQNKRDTGVRVRHPDSGAVGESREHRTQDENKRAAFRRMATSFKFRQWHFERLQEILGHESVEEWVDRQMDDQKIKTEVKVDGKWVEVEVADLNG